MSANDIWVVCDKQDNCDYSHIRQVISKAAELAEANNDVVSVVCIGQFPDEQLHAFAAFGADIIIMCKQSADLSVAAFANILEEMKKITIKFSLFNWALPEYKTKPFLLQPTCFVL